MKAYKEDSYVSCPYYRKESDIEVKCEGIVGTHTVSVFRSKKDKEEHKYDFCCGCFKACPISIELEMKDED